jgi:hypothetical protein
MKNIMLIFCVIFICTIQSKDTSKVNQDSILQMSMYKNSTQIDKNEWKLKNTIQSNDTINVIKFLYRDEVGFSIDSVFCMAIFENIKGTEYKLIAPWLGAGMIIQKSNLLMEKSLLISKKEMKCY